jgi:thiamine pyrophosphate-dependent acetolactate synthase large subunit-like protein
LPPGKKIIHATNDTRDLHKAFAADLGLLGDTKLVLGQLIETVKDRLGGKARDNGVAREIAANARSGSPAGRASCVPTRARSTPTGSFPNSCGS